MPLTLLPGFRPWDIGTTSGTKSRPLHTGDRSRMRLQTFAPSLSIYLGTRLFRALEKIAWPLIPHPTKFNNGICREGKPPPMTESDKLQAFFGERRTDLVRFAALQLRDQSLAEDAVQDTLMAAMQAIDRFQGRSSLKTWVFSILKRKIIDIMRSGRRELTASQLTGGGADERDFDELFNERGFWATEQKPHRWAEPEDSLEQQQFWRIFELCLEHLPTRTAQVFSMRELLDLDTGEICKELGISTSNCWVILHRARMGLRLCLEEQWFNDREISK